MSPFLIFASVLTIIYIIYYAVIISQDVYKKKGQQDTENVESFDISQMNSVNEAIEVTEDGDGFTLTSFKDKLQNITAVTSQKSTTNAFDKTGNPKNAVTEDSNSPIEVKDEENNMRLTFFDNLNEISPEYSVQLEKEEFRTALLTKGKLNNLIKIKETRNEV